MYVQTHKETRANSPFQLVQKQGKKQSRDMSLTSPSLLLNVIMGAENELHDLKHSVGCWLGEEEKKGLLSTLMTANVKIIVSGEQWKQFPQNITVAVLPA